MGLARVLFPSALPFSLWLAFGDFTGEDGMMCLPVKTGPIAMEVNGVFSVTSHVKIDKRKIWQFLNFSIDITQYE